MRERHGDDQVEDAGHDERRQVAGQDRGVLADAEQLALGDQQAEEVDEAGVLDDGDELVHQRGQHPADALRHDDEAHGLAVAHAQRAAGLELAPVDALDAGAEDLADVGAGDQAEGEDAQRVRRGAEDLTG